MAKFDGKVALVTGAASGIGEATARLFAREGASVMIADLQDAKGRAVMEAIRADGGTADYVHCDVTVGKDVAGMVRATVDRFGRLDILHNNAGLTRRGSIADLSEEDWDLVMDVDVKSIFLGYKYAFPEMARVGGGAIVNTASIAGMQAGGGSPVYYAAKAAVINLTRAGAVQGAPLKIRVNCVCPGIINTPLWNDVGGAYVTDAEAMWQMWGQRTPLGRVGMPEDIAKGVVFLASDDAAFITGTSLVIDGGLTMSMGAPAPAASTATR